MTKEVMSNFGSRLRPKQEESTSWVDLVELPNERIAFIYQRLSSYEQVKKSIYNIKAQDALEDLAKEDGYPDELVYVGKRDLGISGTKGREDRPELAYLIELIEAGAVESIYTIHISRLYRDQTLINALSLGELFKEHGVIIVTPQMRLNLRDKMHMRLYRMEVERAADELELMAHRLLGAKDIKARFGYYAGERLPPGFVVNEQEKLTNGERNPDFHTYQIYKPHAKVVRVIFHRLSLPSESPTRVARYCKRSGLTFPPFSPEFDTPANRKTFARTKQDARRGWTISVERIRELADLEQRPVGEVVGRPVPDKSDIELVRELLTNLHETWQHKPDRLKNALLRILLDIVTIQVNEKTIEAELIWRTGEKQCILIRRPEEKRLWTDAELKILREYYASASKDELVAMLPERSWASVKQRGSAEGLSRDNGKPTCFRVFTPEEDELVRAYYADEIDQENLMEKTGRTMQSILGRARRLGIKWQPRRVRWEWRNTSQQAVSPTPKRGN